MTRDSEERLKALDDERVEMVKRHEKPVLIHAISAAYLKEYSEAHRNDHT
ncbi:hypothetical protein JRC49_03415 [Clostridiales bacterium FE2011]|nr:hypothetical protein JRC49_03415 [Clostridiales bacterium FE2011]